MVFCYYVVNIQFILESEYISQKFIQTSWRFSNCNYSDIGIHDESSSHYL